GGEWRLRRQPRRKKKCSGRRSVPKPLHSVSLVIEEPRMTRSTLTHLECGACAARYDPEQLRNLCPACGKPLLARYDLRKAAETLTRDSLAARRADMWRY